MNTNDNRSAQPEPNDDAFDHLTPETPEEEELVRETLRQHRELEAEEQRLDARWKPFFEILKWALENFEEADGVGKEIIHRAVRYGWNEDEELAEVIGSLMLAKRFGWDQTTTREGWLRSR
jgi:hypothetical protein